MSLNSSIKIYIQEYVINFFQYIEDDNKKIIKNDKWNETIYDLFGVTIKKII